ncbi:MAG: iron chelate uptake ABC transporter family permease subunit [Proteobacteria bacterium]|nr:iron chelate uptake ABC transporter family permease subunit [Pseudomonadota bacterium]
MNAGRPSATRLHWWWIGGAIVFLMASIVTGVMVGVIPLSSGDIVRSVVSRVSWLDLDTGLSERDEAILWQIRMPRVILGVLVGSMLSSAGSAYQGVFRNPLADPYLLGAGAGAGLGATLAIAYGPVEGSWIIDPLPLAAFVGAIGGVALAYMLGYSVRSGRTSVTLILAGVAIAAFLTALQTFVQQRESDTLREVYGWILGSLNTAGWSEVRLVLPYVVVSLTVVVGSRRLLDVLSVGDIEATALGIQPVRIRMIVIIFATLGTAAVVAVSGLIGFVGIIVPHAIRLVTSVSYRVIVPLSVLFGGAFLVLADIIARTVLSPAEIPIGVVTALVGAPFFAIVLRTSRGVVS